MPDAALVCGSDSLRILDYSTIAVAVMALVFTVGAFWWLNARRGSITATHPRAYAFGGSGAQLRLRLPLALFNTGARALIVVDLRIALDSEPGRPELRWVTIRDRLRPEPDDGFAFATPFSIVGRGTREVIAEFEPGPTVNWPAPAGVKHRLRLEAQIHPKDKWVQLAAFDLWAPSPDARGQYLAHRNEPAPSA